MKAAERAAFGPGFFGKLPARGDFISRSLPQSFLMPWEDWLHRIWQIGWTRFGDVWPPLVSEGPVWRFVIEEEVCGPHAVAGLLAPSCDKLGRVFPLCLVSAVPGRSDPAALPVTASGWFCQAEALLRLARDPNLDIDAFDLRLSELGAPQRTVLPTLRPNSPGWHVALDPAQAPALSYPALIHDLAATLPERFSLWWTLGAQRVRPTLVVADGLPKADAITAFYDGAWDYWGWNDADDIYPEQN
ncbi:MAG: type VI secretion system-associated protein TagF [Rhodospirillaceae bacterium]